MIDMNEYEKLGLKKLSEEEENALNEELAKRFIYHSPSEKGVLRHRGLSDVMILAAAVVKIICPEGREKSLALTKLEEAKMWASAAVARNPETV